MLFEILVASLGWKAWQRMRGRRTASLATVDTTVSSTYENLVETNEGKLRPAPGYWWVHPDDPTCPLVAWQPGRPHPDAMHVVAGVAEGRWRPTPGYSWVSSDEGDLRVERDDDDDEDEPACAPSPSQLQRIKDLAALGLDVGASAAEIADAFRRLARIHHPDRHVGSSASARQEANRVFCMLRQAYERLLAHGA